MEGEKEGLKEGLKEGRKEGRKDAMKERRKDLFRGQEMICKGLEKNLNHINECFGPVWSWVQGTAHLLIDAV